MNNLETILISYGLDSKEAKLYLAVLELGSETVLPISKLAGIQRSYCYDILDSLISKGLVTYQEKNGRRRYVAEPPEKLARLLKHRLEDVEQALPELKSIQNKSGIKPIIRFYEGADGIMTIYEEILLADSMIAIASPDAIYQALGSRFSRFTEKALAKSISSRELIVRGIQTPKTYLDKFRAPIQQARFLPEGVLLETDIVIFGDKLALISYGKNLHAVLIEDSKIVETHKQLFELLWAAAQN